MSKISVHCRKSNSEWTCEVSVDDSSGQSDHTVTVPKSAYETLTNGNAGVEELVEESFHYLLEREPLESILPEFEIMTIERYFPDYPAEIRDRLG
ncbi:MAG: hypothetical protein ABEK50_03255 [bacterium]